MKRLISPSLLLLCGMAVAAPKAENVTMTQAGSREVVITYTLTAAPAVVTLDIETNTTSGAWVSIGGEHIQRVAGDVNRQVSGKETYTISWLPDRDWPGNLVAAGGARAVVTAWPWDNTPDYLVVNLLTTTNLPTARYYTATNFLPGGLLANPAYRTTSIVMRKILAKDVTWTMGSVMELCHAVNLKPYEKAHSVTLTNNYYIGVFEVTQRQWALVTGGYPSFFTNEEDHSMRPVERVSFNRVRTSSNDTAVAGNDWPNPPFAQSFLGQLRAKVNNEIDFDLPSDAEWEFACRAGCGEGLWNDGTLYLGKLDSKGAVDDGTSDENLSRLARSKHTSDSNAASARAATGGTAVAGTYAPNGWGLYDMHGNVIEWCLDWWKVDVSDMNGRVVTAVDADDQHARRSAAFNNPAQYHRSAARGKNVSTAVNQSIGFRLVCRAGL